MATAAATANVAAASARPSRVRRRRPPEKEELLSGRHRLASSSIGEASSNRSLFPAIRKIPKSLVKKLAFPFESLLTSVMNFLQIGRTSLSSVAENIITCLSCGVSLNTSWTSERISTLSRTYGLVRRGERERRTGRKGVREKERKEDDKEKEGSETLSSAPFLSRRCRVTQKCRARTSIRKNDLERRRERMRRKKKYEKNNNLTLSHSSITKCLSDPSLRSPSLASCLTRPGVPTTM